MLELSDSLMGGAHCLPMQAIGLPAPAHLTIYRRMQTTLRVGEAILTFGHFAIDNTGGTDGLQVYKDGCR